MGTLDYGGGDTTEREEASEDTTVNKSNFSEGLSLPDLTDCDYRVGEGIATPLERFIHGYEIGGVVSKGWRESLLSAIKYEIEQAR